MPNDFFNSFGIIQSTSTVLWVCGLIGLVLGIVLLIVFLPARNQGKYQGASKWFYDFLNFNRYWISWLIKLINIIVATVCFLGGFICLFIVPLAGLGLLVGGVLYRVVFELIMVTLNIRDNVAQINDKLSYLNGPAPGPSPVRPGVGYTPANGAGFAPPARKVCPNCGTQQDPGTNFCVRCGSPV